MVTDDPERKRDEDMKEFFRIVYRALMMIAAYLRRRYGFGRDDD